MDARRAESGILYAIKKPALFSTGRTPDGIPKHASKVYHLTAKKSTKKGGFVRLSNNLSILKLGAAEDGILAGHMDLPKLKRVRVQVCREVRGEG